MPSVCLYFQIHQPFRLRRYSVFDTDAHYFDDDANAAICRRIANVCYLPANRLMLDLLRQHGGAFRAAYSITGLALEQFDRYAPEVAESFAELAATGCVEFLAETSHHSLASQFSPTEFAEQVTRHADAIAARFGRRPTTFRNTELIYSDDVARQAAALGFNVILAEGSPGALAGGGSPNLVYRSPAGPRVLLRNYRLSDDMTFRFGDRTWDQWPLTADRFAAWLDEGDGPCRNLFVDYEAFGEHLDAGTGIFEFLGHLPAAFLKDGRHRFLTPCELAETCLSPTQSSADVPTLAVPKPTSWADTERDVSAWLGNAMQTNAASELYKLEPDIRAANDPALLEDWRRLQSSDHFYYMSTKYFADGEVHKYFSPYESPYDSYINFMNVLDNIKSRAGV